MKLSMPKSQNIPHYLTRAIGVAGLGLIAYEAHTFGKYKSKVNLKEIKTKSLAENFLTNQKLENPSAIKNAVKKHIFNFNLNENFSGFFTSIAGYAKGFADMLVSNIVPLGLALGAVLAPKGLISKTFGAGLIAYGGIFLLQEAFGIGNPNE